MDKRAASALGQTKSASLEVEMPNGDGVRAQPPGRDHLDTVEAVIAR